ncbi:ABC transporter ATP-binding protein, partial [Christensenellaceae bacterium OttesenSCG-928-L17]|nr:ABC transporter ATP-binding protein [Christensenellaceae bacterium OttesenSCG-928-L17]
MIYAIRDLRFTYPRAERPVLENANLTVNEGEILSLLGRNGAGKSTLLGCMLGLLKPESGEILLNGKPLASMHEREIAKIAGYVPQAHAPAFGYTVRDFVVMGCASRIGFFSKPGKREEQDAEEAIVELGISHLADRSYTEISGGERQQAAIARAIVAKPSVVLFDEPTAHLDYSNQLRVLRIVKKLAEKGFAIVITTHNPDHALLLGGRAAVFGPGGSLTEGDVDEVITRETLSTAYGADVTLTWVEGIGRMACVYPGL